MSGPILQLEGITKRYGALAVVDQVSLQVEPGERRAIIGPNGAGKTTLFSIVAGHMPTSEGRVVYKGRDVTKMRDDRRSRLGIAQMFQRSSLFLGLSVLENVVLSVQRSAGHSFGMLRPVRSKRALLDRSDELLAMVGLHPRRDDVVSTLSHGEKRQLELAVALAGEPELILFDEPVAGLSAAETASFVQLVQSMPETLTLLLIEHDIDVVMTLASRITVLDAGRMLAEGDPATIAADERVQKAYLGSARTDDLSAEG
jgi:branched-chain amino acid transport system ATP-binding protein